MKTSAGLPVLRSPASHVPCRVDIIGCPKGTPERPLSLSAQNAKVYKHYKACRAVSSFPDDPLVQEHAAIIRQIEEVIEASRATSIASLIGRLK